MRSLYIIGRFPYDAINKENDSSALLHPYMVMLLYARMHTTATLQKNHRHYYNALVHVHCARYWRALARSGCRTLIDVLIILIMNTVIKTIFSRKQWGY